jgi:hypothetical protein
VTDKKYHEGRNFRKLQKEWYAKAKESGFYDIEGGVSGHLLKGSTSTISLKSLANAGSQTGRSGGRRIGLKKDRAVREFDDVADREDADIDYPTGAKARYYHHAALLACQAFREGKLTDTLCFTWQLHALGEGERVIAELLEAPRSQIRKHLAQLRTNIHIRIDNEHR